MLVKYSAQHADMVHEAANMHVEYLMQLPFSHLWVLFQVIKTNQTSLIAYRYYLKQRIPFLTTSEMKAIMRQSYVHRFNLNDGVGHLHPTTALPCPVCGVEGEWSEEESWSHSTTIVCYNQVFPAEGMYV